MMGSSAMMPDAAFRELDRYRCEVEAALELLEFGLSDGRVIDERTITAIRRAQDFSSASTLASLEERVAFDTAYRDLARVMAPVTSETLRSTSDVFAVREEMRRRSEAASGASVGHGSLFAVWGPYPKPRSGRASYG